MLFLIGSIAGIALVDSLNPTAITLQLLLLSTPKPGTRSAAFILGVFVANYAGGLMLVLGVNRFFGARLRDVASLHDGAQLIIGVLLIAAGIFVCRFVSPKKSRRVPLGVWQSFFMGAAEMALELPTAFPYLAALGLIARESPPLPATLAILLMYNILFVLPLLILLLTYKLLPGPQTPLMAKLEKLFRRWLPLVLRILLLGFGIFLVADVVSRPLSVELPFGKQLSREFARLN